VPRGEVVRAVENDIRIRDEALDALAGDALVEPTYLDFRIDRGERLGRFLDFPPADRIGAVEDLALQVGEIDVVGVGDRQAPNAARREVQRRGAS